MTLDSLWLRVIAFSMLCGVIGYIAYFLIIWFVALYQIFVTIFGMMGGSNG